VKYLLYAVVIFISFEVNGQFDKKTGIASGSGSFTQRGTISFRPTVGVIVVRNFMIGLQDNFNYKKHPGDEPADHSNTVGPVLRYYLPLGRIALFPRVSAGVGSATVKQYFVDWDTGDVIKKTSKKRIAEYFIGVGATYFVAPNIGVETILDFDIKNRRPGVALGLQFYMRSAKDKNFTIR